MKNNGAVSRVWGKFTGLYLSLCVALTMFSGNVLAALEATPGTVTGDDYIEQGSGLASKGGTLFLNFLMLACCAGFIFSLWSKFTQVRDEKKWGDLGTTFAVGLVLLVVSLVVLNIAKAAIA